MAVQVDTSLCTYLCFLSNFLSLSFLLLSFKAMKLTTDLINESPSHINALKDRELVLRGGWNTTNVTSVTANLIRWPCRFEDSRY